jgi:PAS domain S-box-containing protein
VKRWTVEVVSVAQPSLDGFAFACEFSDDCEQVVLVADAQMRFLAASEGACRLLGYSLSELLAMRVPEIVVEPDAADRYRRMVENRRQDGVITLICKSGRRVEALYDAGEAQLGGLTYYVSRLTPVGSEAPARALPVKMRVVIADDDLPTRLLMSTLLSFVEHVEVVGEASDGVEAVQLVQRHDPDLLLLDVQMPRLDGLAAAELVHALRSRTHIVLHSGAADDEMKQRAEALGLRLLDKMHVDQVIDTLVHPRPTQATELPDPRIEAAVLTALTARTTTPVIIVGSDGSVPFYNTLAAELLGLPLDHRDTHIDRVRDHYQLLRLDDHTPVDPDERPIAQAAQRHEPISETYLVSVQDTETPCRFTSLPFFDNAGEYLGAALYIEPIGHHRTPPAR